MERNGHAGRHGLVRLAGCLALTATVLAARPVAVSPMGPAACNAKGKKADLSFTLKDLDGHDVQLGAYEGRVVLLNFWATWCTPCKGEIPGLVALYSKYRSQGLVVLGVSVDDTVAQLKPFVAQFKMNYPVLVGRGHGDLQDAYSPLVAIPTSFLIARNGTVCQRHDGYTHTADFEREILALLQPAAPAKGL